MKFTQPVPSCNTPISLIATNTNEKAANEVVAAEIPLDQAQPDIITIKQEEKETPKPESRPKVTKIIFLKIGINVKNRKS